MKKIYLLVVLACFSVSFQSCDFLTEYPPDRVAADEAIETVTDAETALMGSYAAMRDYWSRGAIELGDVMTDESFAALGCNRHMEMQAYMYSNNNSEVEELWSRGYQVINDVNRILAVIDGISGSTSQKNEIKGQALALRGIAYMELCKWFAIPFNVDSTAVGVPIKQTTQSNEKPPRASVKEVYDYAESDLLQAASLLAGKTATNEDNLRYLSIWSCKAFLARLYLYKTDYVKAAAYASDVINSNKFILISSADNMRSMWRNDVGTEIIFMLGYTNENLGGLIGANYYSVTRRVDPATGKEVLTAPVVNYVPSAQFLDLYNLFGPNNASKAAAADLRYADSTFFRTQTTIRGWQGKLCYKYPGNPKFTATNVNMPKIIRLPELYLIRAEAYANISGKKVDALADYNLLRKNRISGYVNETTMSDEELRDEIFNERLRELCFEGFYWYDLKRAQRGFQRNPTLVEQNYVDNAASRLAVDATSYRWQLPIPSNEVNGNKTIVLNPGY